MSLEGRAQMDDNGYILRGKMTRIPTVTIDTTLSRAGQAAEAKATGDGIAAASALAQTA